MHVQDIRHQDAHKVRQSRKMLRKRHAYYGAMEETVHWNVFDCILVLEIFNTKVFTQVNYDNQTSPPLTIYPADNTIASS